MNSHPNQGQSLPKKIGVGFGVMILKHNQVLLGQRHPDPLKADSELHGEGTWTMPGGKLHFGERFEEGAKREVFEETGLEIDERDLQVMSIANNIVHDAHFVTIGLILKNDTIGDPQIMEPDEITVWKWFDLHNLPTPLFGPSKEILDHFENGTYYSSGLKGEYICM